jgi:DNA-directed RNA polymerase specialized sigma24 family protein
VVNVCYGFLKKTPRGEITDYQTLCNTPCPDSGQTETVVLQHQYRKLIQNAMSVLTKQERLAVELCYLKDLTSIEVARELKIVPKTALIYLSSATKKMKGFLEQKLCEKITC